MSANDSSVANQGEFSARIPGSEPLTSTGHQPGKLTSEADRAPEFHAQTLPAGTAPKESTFTPNPDLNNQGMYQKASTTITGASSGDVHTGLGHPGQGQTSSELRDGSSGRQGLTGVGAAGGGYADNDKTGGNDVAFKGQRNLERDDSGREGAGYGETGALSAEERLPETADSVAAERN